MRRSLSRRLAHRVLATARVLAALASAAVAQLASGFARLSSLSVDVRPMLAQGGELQAHALRADLTAALRRSLGERVVGSQGSRFFGGGQSNYLDGEALLVGGDGAILICYPQLSALPSSSCGTCYDPDSERRVIAAIGEHYAQWLDRSLPGR